MYSAQAKVTDENVEYLLKLSEVFIVRSLQSLLESYFQKRLDERSSDVKLALQYLQLSARNKMDELKKDSYKILRAHKNTLIYSAAWNELLDKTPSLLIEVFDDNERVEDEQIQD